MILETLGYNNDTVKTIKAGLIKRCGYFGGNNT